MFAKVIIDQDAKALDRVFEYKIPDELEISIGERVYVPFGSRVLQGYVIERSNVCEYDEGKLKNIISSIDDQPVIKKELLDLMHFMVKKNHLKYSSTLRLFLPSEMREGRVKELFETFYSLNLERAGEISSRAKKQTEAVEYLQTNGKTNGVMLKEMFGASAIKSLCDKGILNKEKEQVLRAPSFTRMTDKRVSLNEYQQNAIDSICGDKTYLLHGVTGSGKTEVYMNLIER
ncbi:MAG: DEAD/DEAH box helicase family protein, partial [Clostridia bacterium]|nr:DEAD/DEAH box helicase family protein [Clostridia bacterium]